MDLPNFKDAKEVTLDIETHDPDLPSKGPGVRRDGYMIGVAVNIENQFKKYIPIAHRVGTNADEAQVKAWLKSNLSDYSGRVYGANLLYDFDYLYAQGIRADKAKWCDIQTAEPLIDETRRKYGLDVLAKDYLGEGKREDDLVKLYGPKWKTKMRDIDPGLVGYYAEGDVEYPPLIFAKQLERLKEEGLVDLFDMERRLTPMLLYMRQFGVRVDLEAAERLSERMFIKIMELKKEYKRLTGREFVDSSVEIAKVFDNLGLSYPRTAKGSPSFVKAWLEAHPHEVAGLIREIRRWEKNKGTFVDGYILGEHINGRIHCEFNQLRSDDGGTVSGRFSSSHPNLQNIPSRDPEFGPLIRGLFLPEEGMRWWARDWSQIEFRLLVHYAVADNCPGAAEAQGYYLEDPTTDYHDAVADMMGVQRRDAKNLNFGIIYGMGKAKLARDLGRTIEEAEPLMDQYAEKVPFAKLLYKRMQSKAQRRGYVRTLLGRRRRFNLWESSKWYSPEEFKKITAEKGSDYLLPMEDRTEAQKKWGRIRRAYVHKALNAVVQGSAADLMKKAMVDIWEAGVTDVLPIQLTVHDELDGSVGDSKESREALEFVHHTMENCMKLAVPILADGTEGNNWAEAK